MNSCCERQQRVRCGSRDQKGFTLLELLVGMTVFSLLVVTLYSGFRLATRSWEAGAGSTEASNERRLASAFIRRQLGNAFGLAVRDGGGWRLHFEGSQERLMFISDVSRYVGQGGMYEMTVAVEGDSERRLTVAHRLLRSAEGRASDDRDALPKSLIDDVVAAEFAYFGSPRKRMDYGCYDNWENAERLPSLVRVRVSTRTAGDWPEIMVHLKADAIQYQQAGSPDEDDSADSG